MSDGIHHPLDVAAPGGLLAGIALDGAWADVAGDDGGFRSAAALDAALIAAHADGDGRALVDLYAAAAAGAEAEDRRDAAGFYLTQAHVFALEAGHPAADALHARLKAEGREE